MLSIILSTEVNKIMKTYQSGTSDKKAKKNFFARYMYPIIFGTALLIVAAAITLTLVFTLPETPANVDPGPGPSVDVEVPEVTFGMPLAEYTIGKGAALDSLVYSSTLNQWRTHNGVDFAASAGANVMAVCDGTVQSVVNSTLEGTVVTVAHDDGLVSIYKGLAGENVIAEGTAVKTGDVIGTVAESMMIEQLDGTHLHLEMQKNGTYVDPMEYLPGETDK